MDRFSADLNDLLMDTYQYVLKVEECALKSTGQVDLSISELHLIECVGKKGAKGLTISDIAQEQSITLPSVTIAINKLAKKGYVQKVKCQKDGRVVYVTLTRLGSKMYAVHRYFHEQMMRRVSADMPEEERQALLKGIGRINHFFREKIEEMEG